MEKAYDDLAVYLKQIKSDGKSYQNLVKRAEFFRFLNNLVKLVNHILKYLSAFGLIIPLLLFPVIVIFPGKSLNVDILIGNLFLASVFIKLFNVMVDLEIRFIQYAIITIVTVFFVAINPGLYLIPSVTAGFYMVLITLSRAAKKCMKLSTLELMLHDPEGFGNYIEKKEHTVCTHHRKLGIGLFDDPVYTRAFRVKSTKKQKIIKPAPTAEDSGVYPPKGMVRVEIWKRDPLRDLSSIQEFFICCFLGGAQDASAFEFMMCKSLTMLDMVSPKGRTARVLLMACVTDSAPILVVNAVFGREGGLIGSITDDNSFIHEQVEAYARFTGFEKIIYNATPTNKRPILFLSYLEKYFKSIAGSGPVRIQSSLTSTQDRIKLEIFNRRNPISNVYLMLCLEIMNLTDNYAHKGKITGYTADLTNRFIGVRVDTPQVHTPRDDISADHVTIETKICNFTVDTGLTGETAESMLRNLFDPFLEMDVRGLPKTIRVETAGMQRCITGGSALDGKILIHPVVFSIKNRFWKEVIISACICQHLLWRLHPVYSDELVFTYLDHVLPDINKKVIDDIVYLDGLEKMLNPGESWNFISRLIARAVREIYPVEKAFKIKRIYSFIQERKQDNGNQDPEQLAHDIFFRELEINTGFREKYFQGLDENEKSIVTKIMITRLRDLFDDLMTTERIPDTFPLGNAGEIEGTIFRFEKTLRKYAISMARDQEDRLGYLKERCRLMGRLSDVERLIKKDKSKDALKALRDIHSKHREEIQRFRLKPDVRKLVFLALTAPFHYLVEKLNQDMYW